MNGQDRGTWTSASNAEADLRCPGRHLAQRPIPEPASSKDAESGRAIHAALAAQGTPEHERMLALLDSSEKDMHDRCVDIEQRKVAEFFGQAVPDLRVYREQRYWVKFQGQGFSVLEHSGQADAVYRHGLRGLVLDYKTLFGDVPASSSNLQLRDNVCLAAGNLLLSECGAVLIQPWVTGNPDICLYGPEDIQRARREMFERVIASNNPASARVPGDLQCAYCRAKGVCQEYQRWAGALVPDVSGVLGVPMEQWTPEQRSMVAERLSVAQALLDTWKAHLKACLAADPQSVPGWGLADGKVREVITDPQRVFERFCKLVADKATPEQQTASFMGAVAVAKGKLRDAVAGLSGLKGKGLSGAVDGLTEGLVERTVTAPSLKKLTVTAPNGAGWPGGA